MKNAALIIAGLIFAIVTAIHILRVLKGWTVVIGNTPIPMDASMIGGIVAGLLALFMFAAALKK